MVADAEIINPAQLNNKGWVVPSAAGEFRSKSGAAVTESNILLVEIPSDFMALKATDIELAKEWRKETRTLFEDLFKLGYLVTDFVYLPGDIPRSYYVMSHGEGTL